ncbi:RHS repeat-associated core domain-containing protein [Lentzea albida]|uniref:RHS repeat-associated core domain-containing protein n=1 Tax=Lentzea albida TaxID=65499 RepID=A0A1H9GRV4_9PSEU|nr:RHS repeat-associated core domain-containing protein [Lentzea albida]
MLPDYPIERFQVSDRLQFGVNLSDGNLWIDHRDLTIRGTGIDLTLRHSFGYDYKWHINAGQDMALDMRFTNQVHMPVDGGGCVLFLRNADGTFGTASNGVAATLTENADGSYTAKFVKTGETWAFNSDGWPLNRKDRNGNAITYHYQSDGTLASLTDSQGRVTTFQSSGGNITRITDPSGTVVGNYSFDSEGRLTQLSDRDGKTVKFGYNADGSRITSLVDQANRTWGLTYTDYRLTKVSTPTRTGSADTLFDYVKPLVETTQTDPNKNKTVYKFDDRSRQISATDALGNTRSKTWTANSDVQSTTDGRENSTTAAYDTLNNLISTTLPTGAATVAAYTSTAHPNLPTSVKDPAGNEVTREYDTAGNLTKLRSTPLAADLEVRTYTGPKALLDTVRNANGQVTRFGYDQAGNPTSVTPPAPMGATRYTYDSLSRITSVTDGNNKRIDYAYDKLDRIVSVSHNGTVLQTNTYDALGNLSTRSHGGVTSRFDYDARPTGSQVISAVRTQGASTETVSYGYDKAGNLTSLKDPAGTATYGYDAANRLTSLVDPFGQTTTFGYDSADNRTSTTFPGAGTQTNTYDNANRLTGLTVKNTAGAELLKAAYSFTTPAGADSDKMQSKTIAGTTTAYTYDSLRHLSKAGATTFTVDKADNITNLGGTAHVVNGADQLTSVGALSLSYDAAGNITGGTNPSGSFEYSPTNQMVRGVTDGAQTFSASYDTIDQTQPRTITEKVGGVSTTHTFTHTALGTSTVNVDNTRISVARDPDGKLVTEKAGTTRYNLITDHQGSVLALLDTTGTLAATYTYNPYGGATGTGAAAGTNPFRFVGGYTLKGGLTLFGYRFYNSSWGRFTAPDPTHQERNAYAYGKSDPINNIDPTGAYTQSEFESDLSVISSFAGIGTAIGAGGGVLGCVFGPVGCATGAGVGAGVGAGLGAVAGISYVISKRNQ